VRSPTWDQSLGRVVAELKARDLYRSTLIIVSAKHGQSPIERQKLAMEPGGAGNATVTDPTTFIKVADPSVSSAVASFVNANDGSSPFVSGVHDGYDAALVWLQDQSKTNIDKAVEQLTNSASVAAMFANVLPPRMIFDANVKFRVDLAAICGDPTFGDPIAVARAPTSSSRTKG
jgi:hypothetical protein